jgi:AcrR family transcriptional regulator
MGWIQKQKFVSSSKQTVLCSANLLRMAATTTTRPEPGQSARERILGTAYELFSQRGIHDVGIDELVERAGVAKATLYKHFPSKDELVLAFLEQREQIWTYGWVESEARRRGATPEEQLLAIFDLFDEWFHRDDFEGCSFVNTLLEFGDLDHPVGRASADYLENIRSVIRSLALAAGLRDADGFALSWHILMKGSIVQAAEGDHDAARRAQALGSLLIEQHR